MSYGLGDSGLWVFSGKVDPNAVPEPSTWALLILGALGLLYWRKRK
ncbi:MAG: PEP-CTERM sorting domain-containing protein [Thermoguttaceae bacterium]|nr:PEP-CTERM sorting domain-containing protein [Thermoguttaceae bacterium]